MDPFTAMMIMQGVSAVMKHQGDKAAAAAQRAWKYKRDLAIKSRLNLQYSQGRQAFSDTNMMRSSNKDQKVGVQVSQVLQNMKVASAMRASGLPSGQSSDGLLRAAQGAVLAKSQQVFDQLDMKALQLDYRDRDIQQGMDMAWLDAKAQIAGTTYQKDPGIMGLAMGLGSAYMDAKAFDSQMDGEWS